MKSPWFRAALLLLGGMAAALPAWAAPLERLGFREALELAEKNALTREEFAVSGRYHQQAQAEAWRRLWLPSLALRRTTTDRTTTLSGSERDATMEARLDFPLYAGGRDRAGERAARAAGEAAAIGQAASLAELRLATAEAFFLLASSGQKLASEELAVERAAAEAANAQRRRELGLAAGLVALQAGLALREEHLAREQERARGAELALRLSHLVRAEVTPATALATGGGAGGPPAPGTVPPMATFVAWAGGHHPGLLQAAREAEQAAQEVALRGAVRFPELLLTAGYQEDPDGASLQRDLGLTLVYRFGGHHAEIRGSQTSGTLEQRIFQSDGSGGFTSLKVPDDLEASSTALGLTFFDRADTAATAESALLQARLAYAQAARRVVEVREERVRAIQQRYGELLVARQRLEVAGLRVEKSVAEEAAFRKGLAAGTVRFDELLEKRTALNRARLEQIDAKVAADLAWIFLRGAAGMALEGE